jgi:hypothetical protein
MCCLEMAPLAGKLERGTIHDGQEYEGMAWPNFRFNPDNELRDDRL